jgi:hypothetical protein
MTDVEMQFKARLAEIIRSNSDCFIEILRLSGYPEVILCSSNVYLTIMLAYVHIKSMSDDLRTIRLDSPGLLSQFEDYSSRLAAFTPSIISGILKELGKTDVKLVEDLKVSFMINYFSFNQIFTGLMQPTSVEFKKIHAFALLNAAMHEKDVSKWSPVHFETMKNCVSSILVDTKISALEKLEFIIKYVQKLINMLEKTSLWKTDGLFFGDNFHIMFDNIKLFSQPGFLQSVDYITVLQKFPDSGFPSALQDLPSFLNTKLWENYRKLK